MTSPATSYGLVAPATEPYDVRPPHGGPARHKRTEPPTIGRGLCGSGSAQGGGAGVPDLTHRPSARELLLPQELLVVEDGAEVGVNPENDRARGFHVSEGGITVLSKGDRVQAQ